MRTKGDCVVHLRNSDVRIGEKHSPFEAIYQSASNIAFKLDFNGLPFVWAGNLKGYGSFEGRSEFGLYFGSIVDRFLAFYWFALEAEREVCLCCTLACFV